MAGLSPILVLAIASILIGAAAQPVADAYNGFIRVSDGRFVDATCQEYLFSGWDLLETATNKKSYKGKQVLPDCREPAPGVSCSLMFFIIGDDNPTRITLMTSPGVFNEKAFQGLDYILSEASKAGIRLILVPLNLWKTNNGVPQFEKWCGTDKLNTIGGERLQAPYDWFVMPQCRQVYKDYLASIVNRRNSINGLLYKDDPTIFAYNLINEPRCVNCGPDAINTWIADIAQFLKSVDPNHLITVGEEGFFDSRDPQRSSNPAGWADKSGQDFSPNHASPSIDFASLHMWPDNWGRTDIQFGRDWIKAHITAAQALGKPLVVEEYGKNTRESDITSVRDPWFRMVHDMVDESLATGGPLRGVLFWEWDAAAIGDRSGKASTVRDYDTTIKNEIVPFSQRITETAAQLHKTGTTSVPGCTPMPFKIPQPTVVAASGSSDDSSPAPGGGRRLLAAH
ncbi:hypothetical protein N2152v2_001328 [Parachlorella kessleri]